MFAKSNEFALCLAAVGLIFHAVCALPVNEPNAYEKGSSTTTPNPPPSPFQYAFAAGRAPGGKPDRYVEQEGDENGVVRGSYAYLDPNWKWQKVSYLADPDTGFHVLESTAGDASSLPEDTPVVAEAKAKHKALYDQIAQRDQVQPESPKESKAVEDKRIEHYSAFERIRAEHAAIAEEHARLAAEAEKYELIEEARKKLFSRD
ncbi:hypothetical protein TCAL_01551 [Tigriopus californicus]|uniref:Cuticle protein 6 n=1 Tax=Tigriopus californicus TaxID=6832 RepID=A0A553P741_TIGCA|nr:cuticle protein 21-like [Tigriopus californicus]TRY73508.1 hypothetical protein TCAL_01551 [Tigriopus californicus]|eukprot:TCALIF_01551-PA protein Name:"Protein of unknown function" AED:0.01 eAED:0.01 QI:280/1/1/1/0.5/0.66/3/148/203